MTNTMLQQQQLLPLLLLLLLLLLLHSSRADNDSGYSDNDISDNAEAIDSDATLGKSDGNAGVNAGGRNVQMVVIDAGSSGTRAVLLIYRRNASSAVGYSLLKFKKLTKTPGLSAFKNFPRKSRDQVTGLVNEISKSLPHGTKSSTWLILRATAGLRLLDARSRKLILNEVTNSLQNSGFKVPAVNAVKIISGSEEAQFTWLSVNFLLQRLRSGTETAAVLEIGGGSLQLAYAIKQQQLQPTSRIHLLRLTYSLNLRSYLGLGFKESILRILRHNSPNGSRVTSQCINRNSKANFTFGSEFVQVTANPISDSERLGACMRLADQLVDSMHVHKESHLKQLYSIGSLFYTLKYAFNHKLLTNNQVRRVTCPIKDANCRSYAVTVAGMDRLASEFCKNPPESHHLTMYYCISTTVMKSLFRRGMQLQDSSELIVLGKYKQLGWPIGQSLSFLTKYDAGAMAAVPTAAAALLPQLLLLVLLLPLLMLLKMLY